MIIATGTNFSPSVTDVRKQILDVLAEAPAALKPRKIAESVEGSTYDSVRKTLRRMLEDGQVGQDAYGSYTTPERVTVTDKRGHRTAVTASADRSTEDQEVKRWLVSPLSRRGEAGPGAVNGAEHEHDKQVIAYSRWQVRALTGFDVDYLEPIFVAGRSMEPDIRANSWALALPMNKIESSGVYALTLGDRTVVKIVEVLAGGAIVLSSRNRELFPEREILVPLPDAGEPNMYHSQLTGQKFPVWVQGRIVLAPQAM